MLFRLCNSFFISARSRFSYCPAASPNPHIEANMPCQSGTAQMISALRRAGRVAGASVTSPRQVLPSSPLTTDSLCFLLSQPRRARPFSPTPPSGHPVHLAAFQMWYFQVGRKKNKSEMKTKQFLCTSEDEKERISPPSTDNVNLEI